MSKQYRKEKFESRYEALIWSADNKPIYNSGDELRASSSGYLVGIVNDCWEDWHKAIEIVPEKRVIEVWVNVYPHEIGTTHKTENGAIRNCNNDRIGTIKLSKEITIVDGKVVEDE